MSAKSNATSVYEITEADKRRVMFRKGQQYNIDHGFYESARNVFIGIATRDIAVAEFKGCQFRTSQEHGLSIEQIITALVDNGALKPIDTIRIGFRTFNAVPAARVAFATLFYETPSQDDRRPFAMRDAESPSIDDTELAKRGTDFSEAAMTELDATYNKRSTNMILYTEIDFSEIYRKPEKENTTDDNTVAITVPAPDLLNGEFFIRPSGLLDVIDDLLSSGYHVTVNVVNDPEFWRKYPLLKAICGKYPPTCSGPVVGDVNIYANDARGEMVYYAISTRLNSAEIEPS